MTTSCWYTARDALHVLFPGQADVEAVILDLLLNRRGSSRSSAALLSSRQTRTNSPGGGGGGGLACVQVLHILPEQLPQGGRFLLQPPLVILLCFSEMTPWDQGQQLQECHPLEKPGEGPHPAPDALRGQDGQIVRPEQVEEQLIPAAHRSRAPSGG